MYLVGFLYMTFITNKNFAIYYASPSLQSRTRNSRNVCTKSETVHRS
jgi:hypothetical protein